MKTLFLLILPSLFLNTSFCEAQNPTLWGMTYLGGFYNFGTIFSYDVSNDTEIVKYSFDFPDGVYPDGSLIQANNDLLYGMTYASGDDHFGEIFCYDISSGHETDLHDFTIDSGGYGPTGSLIQASNGLLYGMTALGPDSLFGRGLIFSYNISTGDYTDLYIFRGGAAGGTPYGSLFQASDGLLYGMTYGGGKNGYGTIFSFDISNDSVINLHNFGNGSGGKSPYGSLMQASDGLLYGTTQYGGKYSQGVIFRYDISTGIETDIHDFGLLGDGRWPVGSLIQASNGLLYGTTSLGGANDSGTIFSYDISLHKETVLHGFAGDADGLDPQASLTQTSSGLLYGLTSHGGFYHAGTLFSYDISAGAEKVLLNFNRGYSGNDPLFTTLLGVAVPTDVNQLHKTAYNIHLYPDPSSTYIQLSLTLQYEQAVSLSIFNTLGQEVWGKDLEKTKHVETTIPVMNLANGVYILKVNGDGTFAQKEVIVER